MPKNKEAQQKKKQFVVTIYDNKLHPIKKFTVGGKKQAIIEAINCCKKQIKDPVHLQGIAERLHPNSSMFDLWDCLELVQGIFEDWKLERPWLQYPAVKVKVPMQITNDLIDEIEDVKVYELEEAKKFLATYDVAVVLLDSLYYFDYDFMKNVVRGVHLKNLLKEKQKGQQNDKNHEENGQPNHNSN